MTRLELIEAALGHLLEARKLLKQAKAPKALQAAFHASKSTEGARRHAIRMAYVPSQPQSFRWGQP